MEHVSFLIEETGEHLSCLLNPESLVMTRTAGVETRRSSGGRLTGTGLADDPLLFTGGGRTELQLELLFDVDLAPADIPVTDVRQMTRPIWKLAENSAEAARRRRPPLACLAWGMAWFIPGIVTEVAERFDRFAPDGSPLRSWLKLHFVRTGSAADEPGGENYELAQRLPPVDATAPAVGSVEVLGSGTDEADADGVPAVHPTDLGLLSQAAFGTPLLWKQLLAYNGVDDPFHFTGPLAVPPLSEA
ncbi:hypothetical protein D477_021573 [Arthrobacter crystallopoietes BAB-32]|uniref:Contractile injection system tube protein N-terminal domain-containing protein n=1 Tax=Arthrobacter crystallopoietes BAB-32 TaxID=1246476 RepID=N1UWF4_9MICC|nr:hypothetical protein [Arthrobacter crystallopoietes]EMY32162.1 hypothetical protein D477_021573 [Arthrobacter crystallopoietes BAB-32]